MSSDVINSLKNKMTATIEALNRELGKRRTGRANAALLDGIKVDYYGTPSPLNQVAAIQVVDPRLITVKPWEKSMIQAVEKAIQQSSLGFNPNSDGELVRIPIPPLTGQRRQELVKDVKKIGEETKVALRNLRRDANEELKAKEKAKEVSEDELKKGMDQVQKLTDDFVKQVDTLLVKKEKEILED